MTLEDKTLESFLSKNKIDYKEYKHPPVFTVEESKKLKSQETGMHAKCLFLKSDSNFFLVALPAEKRLNISGLRKVLGLKKLSFASPEELKSILCLTPGSVSIFGLINDSSSITTLILDSEIQNAQSIGFHPNINTSTLEIDNENLKKFLSSIPNKHFVLEL